MCTMPCYILLVQVFLIIKHCKHCPCCRVVRRTTDSLDTDVRIIVMLNFIAFVVLLDFLRLYFYLPPYIFHHFLL